MARVSRVFASLRWHDPDQVRRSKLRSASSQPGSPDSRVRHLFYARCAVILHYGCTMTASAYIADFDDYSERLVSSVRIRPEVVGLVLVGSGADRSRIDEWSD